MLSFCLMILGVLVGHDQRVCAIASNYLCDPVSLVVTNSALTDLIALFVLFSIYC